MLEMVTVINMGGEVVFKCIAEKRVIIITIIVVMLNVKCYLFVLPLRNGMRF